MSRMTPLIIPCRLLQLPEDLLSEILLKLPLELLAVLRSVCKLFRACISNKRFARSHLQRWRNHDFETKNVFILNIAANDDEDPVLRGKRFLVEFARAALHSRQPSTCRFLLENGSLQFGGCHDGILCLYEFRNRNEVVVIYICNPVLSECKIISKRSEWLMWRFSTKVCLVPDLDDYKVVVVSLQYPPILHQTHVRSEVCIYSLSDCCWRDTIPVLSARAHKDSNFMTFSNLDAAIHNRSLYWMTRIYESSGRERWWRNVLKVLDLHRESVREIILPDDLRHHSCHGLMRYKECLAIGMNLFKICVMEEEGDDVIKWGKPVSFDVGVPWTSGATSWGYLQRSDEDNNVCFMGNLGNTRLDEFLIPNGVDIRRCITADYNPSLVSVVSSTTSV